MQKQYKISLSEKLNERLQEKTQALGIPTTQYIKHLIIQSIEYQHIPEYKASKWAIESAEEALADIENAIEIDNIEDLDKLCK